MSTVLERSKVTPNRRYVRAAVVALAVLGVAAAVALWVTAHAPVERNPWRYAVVTPVELRVDFCRGASQSVEDVRVMETTQAVTVRVLLTPEPSGNNVAMCFLESRVVSLSSPLGNRPLVTPEGQTVLQLSAAGAASS